MTGFSILRRYAYLMAGTCYELKITHVVYSVTVCSKMIKHLTQKTICLWMNWNNKQLFTSNAHSAYRTIINGIFLSFFLFFSESTKPYLIFSNPWTELSSQWYVLLMVYKINEHTYIRTQIYIYSIFISFDEIIINTGMFTVRLLGKCYFHCCIQLNNIYRIYMY